MQHIGLTAPSSHSTYPMCEGQRIFSVSTILLWYKRPARLGPHPRDGNGRRTINNVIEPMRQNILFS